VALEGHVFKQQTHQKMSDRELIHTVKNNDFNKVRALLNNGAVTTQE
jgi:hypothetical protein